MSDRLDKELSSHIQAVFDAYDEPFDAVNWQRLQRKRQGRIVVFYLKRAGMAAAVALLFTTVILLWNKTPVTSDKSLAGNEQSAADSPVPKAPGSSKAPSREGEAEGLLPVEGKENISPLQADVSADRRGQRTGKDLLSALKTAIPAYSGRSPAVLFPHKFAAPEQVEVEVEVTPGAPQVENLADILTGQNTLPSEYGRGNLEEEEKEELTARTGRFSVGFVTTSLMNYANGNTGNEVHFGAGLTSGLKLNDKFSLHSGLILAENSLSLNNSNSSVRASTYAMDAVESAPPGKQVSLVSKNNIVRDVSSNSMDVNLLVVDIPLNVTYRVGLGGSDLLITGGLSSFAYLDQEYSYHNTLELYTNASVNSPEPVIRDEKPFSHFDFAKQLNVAIGTEVSLGKGSVLVVEPYVKYPLGELTSEHIRYGSAGMNLRLLFGKK